MTTVNNADVWCELPTSQKAANVWRKLDALRVSPNVFNNRNSPMVSTCVSFPVPRGMTVQEAILLLAGLVPEGTEVYAS